MRTRVNVAFFILALIFTRTALAGPRDVAQRVMNALFVEPLGIENAEFVVSTEAFAAECLPHAITVRVFVPANSGQREVLRVSMVIVADRLEFLSAKGVALDGTTTSSGEDGMIRSLQFLSGLNGWRVIEEPARRSVRKGYVDRRMRDPMPRQSHEVDVKTIVFRESTGIPVLIGAPPSPTTANCGKH